MKNIKILGLFTILTVLILTLFNSYRPETDNDKDLFEISKNIRIFSSVYDKLNTYYVDDPQPGDLMKTGIDAMLKSLDPYTVYIPQSKIEDYRYMTTGQYGGIGSMIQKQGEYIVITEPYENSPAVKAGLKAGDKILEVDGKSMIGKSVSEMSMFLKGGAGTELTIKYLRGTYEGEVTFEREEIKVPDVPYYGMVAEDVGYVKLNSFTSSASTEIGKAIRALKDSMGMKKLIFDLRGNGGGLLHEAVNIVNFFIPQNELVVFTKGRLEDINREYKTMNEPFDLKMPVTVLIDDYSASASEIVSGSLQDLDRAVIIGERSYGKGLVQQTKELEFGGIVKLTVAKYYTPSGRCIQKLDYSHKIEGKAEEVPDSLIATFKTKNGRVVKDGRGIDPDIEIETEYYSPLTAALTVENKIFDFATEYAEKHDVIAPPKEFKLSDAEFKEFKEFVKGSDINYTNESKEVLEELIASTKDELFYDDASEQLSTLMTKLTPNLNSDLDRYKDELVSAIENEIVARYYFMRGRIIHALTYDQNVAKAIEVLNNDQKYQNILSGN